MKKMAKQPHQQQSALGPFLPGAVPFSPGAPPTPFHGAENDIEQKGQTAAQQKGQEDGKDRGKHLSGLPRVVEPHQPEAMSRAIRFMFFLFKSIGTPSSPMVGHFTEMVGKVNSVLCPEERRNSP